MRASPDLIAIRRSVDLIGRLSDGIVRLGPFSIGIDGILSWIPAVGELYSTAAAAFILAQGIRAGVPVGTLLGCAALMGGRTLISAVPLAGPAIADVFVAHRWSAQIIVRAIDARLARNPNTADQRSRGPTFGYGSPVSA